MAAPALTLPLTVVSGRFATIDQEDRAAIGQCVRILLGTVEGERPLDPEFGLPADLVTGDPGIDAADLVSEAISVGEPRADTALAAEVAAEVLGVALEVDA